MLNSELLKTDNIIMWYRKAANKEIAKFNNSNDLLLIRPYEIILVVNK